jgi:hypothetical protein
MLAPDCEGKWKFRRLAGKPRGEKRLPFEHIRPKGAVFLLDLPDLELAEKGLPSDIDFVPLVFQGSQGPFVYFAKITDGRGGADERVNVLLGGIAAFHAGENHFEFLGQDTFDFQELILIFGSEFPGPRQVEIMVELFPALEMALHLANEIIEFVVAHRLNLFPAQTLGREKY